MSSSGYKSSEQGSTQIEDNDDLDSLSDATFSRTCTEEEESGWARLCTEDVCPVMSKPMQAVQGQFRPRQIHVLAASMQLSCTVITDQLDMVVDLRRYLSEATGVAMGEVQVLMNKTFETVPDHVIIPSPVIVKGVDMFPHGRVIICKGHFVQVLSDIKEALEQEDMAEIISHVRESAGSLDEEAQLMEEFMMQAKRPAMAQAFASISSLNAFYLSSSFVHDPAVSKLYSEINDLLGHPGETFFENIGYANEVEALMGS
eukprot:gb/GFBE01021308.1/.p1 GENE.gb/GFBE01021308.1/~~gb/GFBE01021308.1/.p1  ORF type:complete len:259 (+),score=73.90 gb/GFBE01021308.1/:1-777(+)